MWAMIEKLRRRSWGMVTRRQCSRTSGRTVGPAPARGRYPSQVFDFLTSSLVTLYVTMDPLLLSALFLGLTHGMTDMQRREVAWRGPLIAFLIPPAGRGGGAGLLLFIGLSF